MGTGLVSLLSVYQSKYAPGQAASSPTEASHVRNQARDALLGHLPPCLARVAVAAVAVGKREIILHSDPEWPR